MKSIACFIDPLVSASPETVEAAFQEALPSLFGRLPEYRFFLLSSFPDLTWEENVGGQVELVQLHIPKIFLASYETRLKKGLKTWIDQHQPSVYISFDKEAVVEGARNTLLFSTASHLLVDSKGKRMTKAPAKLPAWASSSMICLPFTSDKQQVLQVFPAIENQLKVQYPALQPDCQSISWSEQETIKIRHSGGRDYFLYVGPLHAGNEIIELLKSYSLLKNWLMTGMPLILAGPATEETPQLESLLKTYKYRADVTLLPDLDQVELSPLLAGAYLMAYPYREGAATWPLEWAMSAGTPLITTSHPDTKEICGEGAWYAPSGDLDAWAHQMMLLYKDEHQRSQLIEKEQQQHMVRNQSLTLDQYTLFIRQLSA